MTVARPLATRVQLAESGRLVGRGLVRVVVPSILLALSIGLWQLAVVHFNTPEFELPSPSRIVSVIISDWPVLWPEWLVTIREMLIGLALAFAVAMVLGYVIAHSKLLRLALYPPIIASQTLPVIAIAPILVIWFGYDITPKVIITALIAFFPLAINTIHGYDSVSAEYRRFFLSMGASRWQVFRKLSLPTAAPSIFAGLKVSATLAVIGATVGEWVGSDQGLGHLIVEDTGQLYTARVFASIALLAFSGIVLFVIVTIVERIVLRWRQIEVGAAR